MIGNMKSVFLSVVVPSYNESEELKKETVDVIEKYLKSQKYNYEVLIVDDGSTNGSREILKKYIKNKAGFKLIGNEHGGKAITVMTGLLQSEGEVALFTDMDQATPIEELAKLLPDFKKGFDIVIGSRQGRKGAPLSRKLAAWGFSTLRNLILGLPFADTQCGFKAFNRKAIEEVFPAMLSRWQKTKASGAAVNAGFDVEVLYSAKNKGLKIAEVEVNWHHVGTEQVQLIADSLEAMGDMLRLKLNSLKGLYA